jgi:benzoyl-CoA reductase subunit B
MTWLEQEWGAVVVMDMQGDSDYTPIDTSSEDAMWLGLARRGLFETPMMRQAVGPAECRVDEMVRVIKDYKIDVVVWPNHMGHKETAAVYGIIREICRELGVPVLDIGMDVFDNRYTTADEIKDKFTNFFRTIDLG